jgi:hypothetical protein
MAPPSQFISCTEHRCPMNQERRCRSAFISVDENGCCTIRNNGPYNPRSQTDNYVEITECLCQKCQWWEVDEAARLGKCGFNCALAFLIGDDENGIPYSRCREISSQIEPPKLSRTANTATP